MLHVSALLFTLSILVGCGGGTTRPVMDEAQLTQARLNARAEQARESEALLSSLMTRLKSEVDAYEAGQTDAPPVIDMLVISGGGDWGAFGAGFLDGWGKVEGDMARPQFDIVTGVSTGALIAPFAFLGTDEDYRYIVSFYRNPQETWVKYRGMLYFWPSNPSFTTIPGLEAEMDRALDDETIARLADHHEQGRMLVVNTTNVDLGQGRAFDVLAAARAGDRDRVHQILLASSAIPGAFPPREIDGHLYVDGAVTGNILYGGKAEDDDTLPARWHATYPDTPLPKTRYWIIFNNQVRYPPQVTPPRWPAIVQRGTWMSNQTATLESIRRIYDVSEILRLRHGVDIEVRYTAVPDGWTAPKPGTFIPETMNNLADIGQAMGADPSSWNDHAP